LLIYKCVSKIIFQMKVFYFFLLGVLFIGCEEEFRIDLSDNLLYDSEWKLWEKTIESLNTETGIVTTSISLDPEFRIIFAQDSILRSTNTDGKFRSFATTHLSLDSIGFEDPQSGIRKSYIVQRFFGRRKPIYHEEDPLTNPFYTFLMLKDREKFYGEDQELTEFLLLYRA